MRIGEAWATPTKSTEKRASVMPKKSSSEADKAAGGTIGELIKQKLGAKLAIEKDGDADKEEEKKDDE